MIIIKLGGSLITDKSKKFFAREDVIRRIALEIKEASEEIKENIVVVHGGGSFGHFVANEYKIRNGMNNLKKNLKKIEGVAKTRLAMHKLNEIIIENFIEAGINAVGLQTSCLAMCMNDEIHIFNSEYIKRFIDIGAVPVLYGDVVLDLKKGFTILSGDDIVCHLAKVFNAKRIILAIDKDGVFESMKSKKLICRINRKNFKEIKFDEAHFDVTGSLKAKIEKLLKLADEGYESLIINGLVEDRIKKAILGEEVVGTKITA